MSEKKPKGTLSSLAIQRQPKKNEEKLTSGQELILLIHTLENIGYEVTGIVKESDISKRFNITIQRPEIDVRAV
ncbi:unnamed protein product [marine sediment metagenome]|uniref:Uncharacterized protein n=1 Tax=marine sediment metagenome TaxID=412755 RepID=X1U881_9ZZZZ